MKKLGVRSMRGRGFTILEVMMAATVMALAIGSSIIVLQFGMRAIDTARCNTLAGQILQSQMEKLRMLNWGQLTQTSSSAASAATFTPDVAIGTIPELQRFRVAGVANRCSQSIVSAPVVLSDTKMVLITLTASWRGLDGQLHTRRYITYYGKDGLSDFFYAIQR
ncbi:MAG: hypothetical protein ABIZ81_03195 [Opitutaceae bacterium]